MPRSSESPIRRGLRFAVLEAIVVGGMFAAAEAWLVPLLQVHLGAAAHLIGLLTVLPQVIAIFAGPWAKTVIAWIGGNKRASLLFNGIQVACLLLLSVPLHAQGEPWAVPLAMGLIVVFNGVFAFAGPAWLSWMGDLIPPGIRGRYSSQRTRLFHLTRLGFAGVFAGIIALMPIASNVWGLQIILVVAALSRLASALCMAQQPEMPPRPALGQTSASQGRAAEITSLVQFVRRILTFPMGRWTLVWACLAGGVSISGPFFQAYMLSKEADGGLGLDAHPFLFLTLIYTSTVVRLLWYPTAGRLVDRHGPAACLRIAVAGIFLVPVGWCLVRHPAAVIVSEMVSGLAWGLAECAIGVLQFGCHRDPQQRAQLLGWNQTLCGVMGVAGSALGTLLMTPGLLPTLSGSVFLSVFVISAVARLGVLILALRLLPGLKEGTALWEVIPGASLAAEAGRNLIAVFRRTDDEH